ncbi:MAG: hypothetical protein SNJ57_16245 [Cyanobacteriota bacterium]
MGKKPCRISVDIQAIELMVRRSPGLELHRIAIRLGLGDKMCQKLRDRLMAEIFCYPDRVRMCCDRFAASKPIRESLMRLSPASPDYQKTLKAAIGQVQISLYPGDYQHRLAPMGTTQAREPECKIWVDPKYKTWTPDQLRR